MILFIFNSQCFPFEESWYMIHRNYEFDPVLGNTSKCVWATDIGSTEDGATPTEFHYGGSTT